MNKMRILYGVFFVITRPIIAPVQWLVKYIKDNYNDGCATYDWNARFKRLKMDKEQALFRLAGSDFDGDPIKLDKDKA